MPLSPEEALRRHALGDRTSEVLAALSAGAFDAYHDPWEPTIEEGAMPQKTNRHPLDEPKPAWVVDPQSVFPISFARIEHWATVTRGWDVFRAQQDDALLVRFRYSPNRDRSPELALALVGTQKNILKFQVRSNTRIPPGDFLKALRLVNTWNQDFRWPSATVWQDYLHERDGCEHPTEADLKTYELFKRGELVLEQQLHLRAGIHQAGLEVWLSEMMDASWDFWELAHKDWGL